MRFVIFVLAVSLSACANFSSYEQKQALVDKEHHQKRTDILKDWPDYETFYEQFKYAEPLTKKYMMADFYANVLETQEKEKWNIMTDEQKISYMEQEFLLHAQENNQLQGLSEREKKREEVRVRLFKLAQETSMKHWELTRSREIATQILLNGMDHSTQAVQEAESPQPIYHYYQEPSYPRRSRTHKVGDTYFTTYH